MAARAWIQRVRLCPRVRRRDAGLQNRHVEDSLERDEKFNARALLSEAQAAATSNSCTPGQLAFWTAMSCTHQAAYFDFVITVSPHPRGFFPPPRFTQLTVLAGRGRDGAVRK